MSKKNDEKGNRAFTWTGPNQMPANGPALETGAQYTEGQFEEGVAELWVNAGFATWVKESKSDREEK